MKDEIVRESPRRCGIACDQFWLTGLGVLEAYQKAARAPHSWLGSVALIHLWPKVFWGNWGTPRAIIPSMAMSITEICRAA